MTGLLKRQPTQTVVAAEFDNYDLRAKAQHGGKTGNCIFGGGSTGALIHNFVVISARVEESAESSREGLARRQSVTSGDTVAIADKNGRRGGKRPCDKKQECN